MKDTISQDELSRIQVRCPLFVIGSPRSGTSLLRLLLTSHSQVIVPPECGFIVWLYDKYRAWSAGDSIRADRRAAYLDDLYGCKKFDTWDLEREVIDKLISDVAPEDYATLCALIYIAYARKNFRAVTIWGDKNNFHINHLPLLHEIYPDARYLHIVRDGRDVACSYREVMQAESASPYSPKLSTSIDAIAQEWSANVTKVDEYLSTISASNRLTVRYEDLVREPESTITRVCNWLGLEYESQMLDFYVENRRMQLEPALTMGWKQRTMEPISADTVGRYRNLLSPDEQSRFLNVAYDVLTHYGYDTK